MGGGGGVNFPYGAVQGCAAGIGILFNPVLGQLVFTNILLLYE